MYSENTSISTMNTNIKDWYQNYGPICKLGNFTKCVLDYKNSICNFFRKITQHAMGEWTLLSVCLFWPQFGNTLYKRSLWNHLKVTSIHCAIQVNTRLNYTENNTHIHKIVHTMHRVHSDGFNCLQTHFWANLGEYFFPKINHYWTRWIYRNNITA